MWVLTKAGHYHGEDYGEILEKADTIEDTLALIKKNHMRACWKIEKVQETGDNIFEVTTLYDENCECEGDDVCNCPEESKNFVEDDMEWFVITKV